MKTRIACWILLLSMLVMSCNFLTNVGDNVITPSKVNISENRDVSGFNAIEFSAFGKMNIIQGDQESLNISGPDNLVPRIITTVENGTLVIKAEDVLKVNPLPRDNPMVFTIVVKELTALHVSGFGDVQVETLSPPSMRIDMSGAGKILQNQITTDDLQISLSGVGEVEVTGSATQATVDISGAGNVNAPDLEIETAQVTVSGVGGATLWVTGQLTGNISGAGNVSYYGNPQTSTNSTGLGNFKSLGDK